MSKDKFTAAEAEIRKRSLGGRRDYDPNECPRGRHRWDRHSVLFPDQRSCRCGAVEGENPN